MTNLPHLRPSEIAINQGEPEQSQDREFSSRITKGTADMFSFLEFIFIRHLGE